jgi:hypothetical protein
MADFEAQDCCCRQDFVSNKACAQQGPNKERRRSQISRALEIHVNSLTSIISHATKSFICKLQPSDACSSEALISQHSLLLLLMAFWSWAEIMRLKCVTLSTPEAYGWTPKQPKTHSPVAQRKPHKQVSFATAIVRPVPKSRVPAIQTNSLCSALHLVLLDSCVS